MWQRVQTLYFAIATGILIALALCNVGYIYTAGAPIEGVRYIAKLPYAILIFISLAANAVATVSWGHRALQIRLAGGSAVLLLALQIWLIVDYFNTPEEFVFRWTALLPLVAFVFDILAIRGVMADELLVRSASRLRSTKRKK